MMTSDVSDNSRRSVRRTGRWLALLVIMLFVGTFLAKGLGLLPSPQP